eukprot:2189705-Rhodomonas_salina.1
MSGTDTAYQATHLLVLTQRITLPGDFVLSVDGIALRVQSLVQNPTPPNQVRFTVDAVQTVQWTRCIQFDSGTAPLAPQCKS